MFSRVFSMDFAFSYLEHCTFISSDIFYCINMTSLNIESIS